MPTFDFFCEKDGWFEIYFKPFALFAECPACGSLCEQRWKSFPSNQAEKESQTDKFHPSIGIYTSRADFNRKLEAAGQIIREPGFDKDCKRNLESRVAAKMKKIDEKIETIVKERDIHELHRLMEVDRKHPHAILSQKEPS